MPNQKYKFRGGTQLGIWWTSWPSGILEVSRDSLSIYNEWTKDVLYFSKDDIKEIEIVKYIPIIGYGFKIHHTKEKYSSIIYFWYVSFNFSKLINTFEELGWAVKGNK